MSDGAAESGTGWTGFRRYTWWTVPGTTAFLLVLITALWLPDLPPVPRAVAVAALAATAAASVVLLGHRIGDDSGPPVPWLAVGVAGAAVLAALALSTREYGRWALAPAVMVAVAAAFLPLRRRAVLLAVALPVFAVPGALVAPARGDDPLHAALFPVGLLAFTVWAVLGPLWAWDVAARLDGARRLSAELAVREERLRFSADLHDIQGHHLQVIALKSELAARLAAADPARAATEMAEVHTLAVTALQDTRALVQGYRRTTLDEEIANATRVLTAADIDARTDPSPGDPGPGDLPPATRHLLGLVMRETVTNILRHSHARNARVAYAVTAAEARLTITNDGVPTPDAAPGTASDGTGLTTLADRLRAAGGTLTWERTDDRFTVTAVVPTEPT
ncbi:hypothetical protein GCM10009678_37250 [Actinomadura kijaniata]|uniref:Two-component system sensor histidine kinase DesK n=1 Tax=Actinomadura namibiensis TaxID=182080 RepID=A0A7W3LZA4_ACTNM|nr:histidine kinase [Actinomadura namibiensis]MBA8957110.1 two-component system sensor histidine kinase DesK [Actinomadura namibiensis]